MYEVSSQAGVADHINYQHVTIFNTTSTGFASLGSEQYERTIQRIRSLTTKLQMESDFSPEKQQIGQNLSLKISIWTFLITFLIFSYLKISFDWFYQTNIMLGSLYLQNLITENMFCWCASSNLVFNHILLHHWSALLRPCEKNSREWFRADHVQALVFLTFTLLLVI